MNKKFKCVLVYEDEDGCVAEKEFDLTLIHNVMASIVRSMSEYTFMSIHGSPFKNLKDLFDFLEVVYDNHQDDDDECFGVPIVPIRLKWDPKDYLEDENGEEDV